jgi:hypothetical protein
VQIAGQIAEGDLAVVIDTRAGDNDSLLAAMRMMRDKLAAIVSEVRAVPRPSPPPPPKSHAATSTCPVAPSSRPAPWKRPPPPWSS